MTGITGASASTGRVNGDSDRQRSVVPGFIRRFFEESAGGGVSKFAVQAARERNREIGSALAA